MPLDIRWNKLSTSSLLAVQLVMQFASAAETTGESRSFQQLLVQAVDWLVRYLLSRPSLIKKNFFSSALTLYCLGMYSL